jgi:HAD superfamily phosphoserine phosphatase-like hydrolase
VLHSRLTGKLQCHYGEIMQRIAIYDMDRTITRLATFGPFLAYAVPRYRPWRILFAPALIVTILAYALKLLDRARLKEINLGLMLGRRIDAATLTRISAGFAGRTLARNVFRAALDRIDQDRADGCRIVIASASYYFYVSQIGRLLGADAVATRATMAGGDIDPKIDGENCYGEAKLAMVNDWLKLQSIRRDSVHIRFYSDHASDAPCLAWADEGFAANPHGRLRALAGTRGWTIIDWA